MVSASLGDTSSSTQCLEATVWSLLCEPNEESRRPLYCGLSPYHQSLPSSRSCFILSRCKCTHTHTHTHTHTNTHTHTHTHTLTHSHAHTWEAAHVSTPWPQRMQGAGACEPGLPKSTGAGSPWCLLWLLHLPCSSLHTSCGAYRVPGLQAQPKGWDGRQGSKQQRKEG